MSWTSTCTRPCGPAPAASSPKDLEPDELALIAEGLSNNDLAGRLLLSPLTVKTHVSQILGKLAARDRAQLVVIAYETGLVPRRA
jgi:DNA-binding NarL/FixJ family response regulator